MNPHPIEWLVIPAPDLKATCRFYHEAFGFETRHHTDTFYIFQAANLSGAFDAGLKPAADAMSFSITVTSIKDAKKRIIDAGGQILGSEYDLPDNLGKCCHCADPNGQVFEIYCAS